MNPEFSWPMPGCIPKMEIVIYSGRIFHMDSSLVMLILCRQSIYQISDINRER